MNGADDVDLETLRDEIETILARLAHSRQQVGQDNVGFSDDMSPKIEACALCIANLSPVDRRQMQPLLLAFLDEVDRTVQVFQDELAHTRNELTTAQRSRIVGAAYQHLRKI